MDKHPAYNIDGNKGFQLILTNGSKIVIGTQKEPLAKKALAKIYPPAKR